MRATTKTRVQRRIEKKQALLLVLLVLVISLVSFALGVIVGRHRIEPPIVQYAQDPQRIPVAETPPAAVESAPTAEVVTEGGTEHLTFYDNLSKGEAAPLGSGINLPPAAQPPALPPEVVVAEPVAQPRAEVETPATEAVAVAVEPAQVSPSAPPATLDAGQLPAVSAAGGWVVQVFSSRSAADAGILRDKLNAKGYPAFIAEADLGPKGFWYRVLLGPYADKAAALQAQAFAEEKDKLQGFAKRR